MKIEKEDLNFLNFDEKIELLEMFREDELDEENYEIIKFFDEIITEMKCLKKEKSRDENRILKANIKYLSISNYVLQKNQIKK